MIFNDFIVYGVLPFMLVFVIVFAILQKSKLFGEGKQQIDALIALVIGLLLVAVPGPQKDIIVNIMPWLAVALSILLVFFILYGFVAGDMNKIPDWMRYTFLAIIVIFIISLIYYLTNIEVILDDWFSGRGNLFVNLFVLALVVGGIWWAVNSK